MKPKVITIIGNVACGKTTAIPVLAKAINADVLDADNLFQTTNPFKDLFLSDLSRWALANESWLVVERVKLFNKFLSKSKKNIHMIDSGLLMSWVYAKSHVLTGKMTQAEWDLFEEIFNKEISQLPKNDLVIYFHFSYETLMKRIGQRGRDYELRQYSEYVKELQLGLDALTKKLQKDKVKILTITEKEAPDFKNSKDQQEKVIRLLKQKIRN